MLMQGIMKYSRMHSYLSPNFGNMRFYLPTFGNCLDTTGTRGSRKHVALQLFSGDSDLATF